MSRIINNGKEKDTSKKLPRVDIIKNLHAACIEERKIQQEILDGTFVPKIVSSEKKVKVKKLNIYKTEWRRINADIVILQETHGNKFTTIVIQRIKQGCYHRYAIRNYKISDTELFGSQSLAKMNYRYLLD